MAAKEDEFLIKLRSTFRVEAAEHLHVIAAGLLELERPAGGESPGGPEIRAIVERVFRAAHSLKGAARAVDFTDVEALCQSLEDTFAAWMREGGKPRRESLDAAHATLDAIDGGLGRRSVEPPPAEAPARRHAEQAGERWGMAVTAAGVSDAEETVRVPVARLAARMLQAEEMLALKLAAARRAGDLDALTVPFEAWRKHWTAVEPEVRMLRRTLESAPDAAVSADSVARLAEFLSWNFEHVRTLETRVAALSKDAASDRNVADKLVDELLESSKKLVVLPFSTISASFPKLVRDLCREQGKEADLVISGEGVEIDKRILDELKAPLIHLLRNCADHGIEPPAVRVAAGKPSRGTIAIEASRVEGDKVRIVVADDGSGLEVEAVKRAAVAHGVISDDEAATLADRDAQRLIFEPEVSTSPVITRLSGRGLGLAIVREKAEKLGGRASVETDPGRGTRFSIVVPAMLATFRGTLVEVAQQVFVLPTLHVSRVMRVRSAEIETIEGRPSIAVQGRRVALVRLADVLELTGAPRPRSGASNDVVVVVLGVAEQSVGFAVDAVLDEHEVLVKALRRPLARVRNVAGATVLGSGQVAVILNVSDLLRSARTPRAFARGADAVSAPTQGEAKSILVVEDSITSRMLIKGILESAGFKVNAAVDGVEAWGVLVAEPVDLVVSDVEMPRMNGFELTARLRADARFADLPVVLVTALDAREERERGIDAGANAYIVKGSFEQSDLLEAVRRLV